MTAPVIFVVDDDEGVRSGLRLLLASAGLGSLSFADPLVFLDAVTPDDAGCVLLDVRMPGIGGLDLHERLLARRIALPVIILTGHGDVPMAVRAMKRGAFDFIQKPFNDQFLLDRVNEALRLDAQQRERRQAVQCAQAKLERLTTREREVLQGLVRGQANKVIAAELGISERTVELHRAHCLEKLDCRSVVQMAQLLTLAADPDADQ